MTKGDKFKVRAVTGYYGNIRKSFPEVSFKLNTEKRELVGYAYLTCSALPCSEGTAFHGPLILQFQCNSAKGKHGGRMVGKGRRKAGYFTPSFLFVSRGSQAMFESPPWFQNSQDSPFLIGPWLLL